MFQSGEFSSLDLIISFIFSTLSAFVAAYYADKKGRSSLGWFILGSLFTIFALITLYFLPSLTKEGEKELLIKPSPVSPDPVINTPPSLDLSSPPTFNKVENSLWFYLDQNHQQMGPVSLIALRELWNRGLLELNSYVWTEGMEKWEKVNQLADLKIALSKETGE